jgi:cytochrome c-type biogenesis protein
VVVSPSLDGIVLPADLIARAITTAYAAADTATTVTTGPLLLAAAVAVAAGAVSFASPCVVPLVPGYLAYLAGLVGADTPAVRVGELGTGEQPGPTGRWRAAGAAGLFVLGFTVVFGAILVGVVYVADTLTRNQVVLQRIGGVVTIVMGLAFVGLIPALSREHRPHLVPRAGLLGAPLLGAVFGLGWVPCIGPTLAGVVAVAAGTGGSSLRGVVLTLAYCAGLGLPFVLLAVGAAGAVRTLGWLRRHIRGVQIGGGLMLIVVGILLVTGVWGSLIASLQTSLVGYTPPI